ncbi:DnaJ domain-containing protein [Planomicrobium okeanokoites]|uniref:DnaJ domain-containing protein n=1 Tax=Planomicrobium okeanokoites TaxID=244 RepID=UPI0024933DE5|nr:DnaJ domain-containing protein [Planomicrobium okeanokoites]
MGKFIDYYTLLNILPTASEELIKRAYRIQSKEVHPDQGGNEQQFILLTEAYEVLSNPVKRREYDQQYAYYQQAKEQTKESAKEENGKSTPKDESQPQKVSPKFSFDFVRYGKVMLGAIISLSILAKAISAFEESAEPEIPENPIVFPVTVNEKSNEVSKDSEVAKYELNEAEDSNVESIEHSIEIPEESETYVNVVEENDQSEMAQTDISTYTTTDSPSLYVRYLDRIYKLEDDMQSYGVVWETGSDAEITQASYNQLAVWDDLLNEIYQTLRIELIEEEFVDLRNKQRSWIVEKERIADTAILDFAGGSWEVPVYNDAQMEETRKRCYWLVMNYMN